MPLFGRCHASGGLDDLPANVPLWLRPSSDWWDMSAGLGLPEVAARSNVDVEVV